MKTLIRLGVLSASLLAAGLVAAQAMIGQPAPGFTSTDTEGKPVKLADYKGKHVVLEWVNPGCPYVQKHYNSGNMPATQKDARARDVVWLAVNSTAVDAYDYRKPADLTAWLKAKGATPTATLMDVDGKVGRAYGARTTPHMYLIDPQGKLIYAGAIDSIASANASDIKSATNYVKQALDEALAGRPLSKPTSQAYGCSIKYARAD
jgi:AhpC/TSA family